MSIKAGLAAGRWESPTPRGPLGWWVLKLVEVSHRITALRWVCSCETIPPSLPLLSCFSPLDPILHLAAPAWLSHSVSVTRHCLLCLLQWSLSLGLAPFPCLSIPGELQVRSGELSHQLHSPSLPGWLGQDSTHLSGQRCVKSPAEPCRACPQEGTGPASLEQPSLPSLGRQALGWTCQLC